MPNPLKKLASWFEPDYRIPRALLTTGGWFQDNLPNLIRLVRWVDLPRSRVRASCTVAQWNTLHAQFYLRWEPIDLHRRTDYIMTMARGINIRPSHPLYPLAVQLFLDHIPNLPSEERERVESGWEEQLLEVLTQ